jgi:rsbT co-antagonist protein RsbR
MDVVILDLGLPDSQGNIIGGVKLVTDITERLVAEAKARQLQEDLIELSTPVLSLWEGVLSIPLIGTLDSRRAQDAMEKGADPHGRGKAQVLVVDITGVPTVDTMVAKELIW